MKTNNKIETEKTASLNFQNLWNNHPTITGDNYPCDKGTFQSQCAIRMGVCLTKCGVDTSKLPGVEHCWLGHKGQGHTIRAMELAKGLADYPIAGIEQVNRNINPSNYSTGLNGKTGIVFFKDYWQRQGESFPNRSGDHIDLWNASKLTDWKTWMRIHLRIGSFGLHTFSDDISDFRDSKEIWFWQVS